MSTLNIGNLLHAAANHVSTAAMQLLVKRVLDVAPTIASNGETVIHNAAQDENKLAVERGF